MKPVVSAFLWTFTATLNAAGWPQWMGPQRDGVWDEPGLAESLDLRAARQVWSAKVGGGYSGPAVSDGRVFLMNCHRPDKQDDTSEGLKGEEQLLCLDAKTGAKLWEQRWPSVYKIDYPSGPRVTPTVHDGLVYALGAEGHLLCAEAATGRIQWRKELTTELKCKTPMWGFAGHPLIFEDLLICLAGGDGTTCVAWDRKTGTERWRALSSKEAGYCPPVLINAHGKPQLIVWHGEAINALDPRAGKVHWSIPRLTQYGVSMASPQLQGDELLVTGFWWGSKMLKLQPDNSVPPVVWETKKESDTRTEHLNALMCTPLVVDGHLYGVCSYGQLRCLEWRSGRRCWETFAATTGKEERWGNAFLTRCGRTGHDFLIFSETGDLIHAALTPQAYTEKVRRKIIPPNCPDVKQRPVVWSHPAYADGHVFVRNHGELRCWRIIRSPAP